MREPHPVAELDWIRVKRLRADGGFRIRRMSAYYSPESLVRGAIIALNTGSPASEQAVFDRENAVTLRENAVALREDAVALREGVPDSREDTARAKTALEAPVMAQLREANEHLVIATVDAQARTEMSERAGRQKEEFLAMLAHELRNPLAPIVNALAVLRRTATSEPMVPWAHDIIKRQIDHMTRLLDDLLDVARVISGKIVMKKRRATVSDIMLQAVELSRPAIEDRKQQLTIANLKTPLTIDGDLQRLVQVFSNLLNNASKYTPEGGAITFSAQEHANTVVFRVADNGLGIEADALPGIFDLFTQENRSLARSHGGLGIGLTVVRAIVELHGGAVTVQSGGPNAGSAFEVTLPLTQNLPDEVATEADLAPVSFPSAYRIVLIEDNLDAAMSLKTLLELMGCEVATAGDGISGVKLALAQRPQIVLCDIGLPDMDGYAVATRIREEMQRPLPILFALTGYGQPEDRARAQAAGFDHHLVKPVDPETLLKLMAAHTLERRASAPL